MTTTDPTSRLPHVRVTKWEYRVADAKTAAGEENYKRLGDEGWEFVEVLSMKTELGFHTTYLFKRPKEWG